MNDYYYLDTDNLVANRTIGDGMYPYFLDQTALPAGFFEYWDAKGVVSGASGWQAVMWDIINGEAPMFFLKVDGTSFDLIDGLQYLASGGTVEEPLRVSGDYPFGTYTFWGDVFDEFGYPAEVLVDITFNDKPVADDQSLTTPEDVALAITLTASDGFPGDPFIWIVDEPAHGVLTGTAPDLLYTPDMDYYGPDSFTFKVNDGFNDSELATITIDVTSIEDDPIAEDDYYETPMGVTLTVAAPGVMDNDYDGDPTDLMLVILGSGPEHGTVTLYGDGSFVYIPTPGYYGPDSFEYTLLSLPTRVFLDQATVYIDVVAYLQYIPLLMK
ncbi:MAG: cadherin-like domain-containing protein [Bacteroidales bacterium]|nr:cadherin-like domain-containing protein [Bacteroidales bacterium]